MAQDLQDPQSVEREPQNLANLENINEPSLAGFSRFKNLFFGPRFSG